MGGVAYCPECGEVDTRGSHAHWCSREPDRCPEQDERRCGGCGEPVPAPEDRVGWRFTDAPWCPKCAWLA